MSPQSTTSHWSSWSEEAFGQYAYLCGDTALLAANLQSIVYMDSITFQEDVEVREAILGALVPIATICISFAVVGGDFNQDTVVF